ncbi:MAG: tRNA (adenosine(37)-N6)-threonylcarbamoyltransferase complex ATPase subunit type 1 TsaE [Xanthobacteraceae bacterium]|nr:tRNA (adenosine(37)-N6)-threonylcarbamoyltransferase complex ATPase subunit type 1 TsaE [Xanthobacteraceae bacterium]
MQSNPSPGFSISLADEEATRRLAVDLANLLRPGDFVALAGDLGAGKTTLARAMIAHLAGDVAIEVPSPTFTLVQTYDLPKFALVHVDLYRVSGADELAELGIDDIPGAVVVMEWPDRAAGTLPPDRIEVALALSPDREGEKRVAHIAASGTAAVRIAQLAAVHRFLEEEGYGTAVRRRIAGDASSRSYERLDTGGGTVILMNWPAQPDGPPVKRGLPYSAIAHLAENVKPFVAMALALRARGLSAPKIYAADYAAGLLVLEDLGSELVVEGDPPRPIVERYASATDLLVALHGLDLPSVLPVAPKVDYALPSYDLDAFLIEAELILDWYLPHRNAGASAEARAHFQALWRDALRPVLEAPRSWVLRDFHSPNLLWLEARDGIAKVGLLDFQDAVLGPPAYDVASLLQDARVDVPEDVEIALFGRYVAARRHADPRFDANAFARLYATLAAQRSTKILGIFARLDRRDHKPQYLRHMPRVWRYLRRALAHPALHALDAWYLRNVPPPG